MCLEWWCARMPPFQTSRPMTWLSSLSARQVVAAALTVVIGGVVWFLGRSHGDPSSESKPSIGKQAMASAMWPALEDESSGPPTRALARRRLRQNFRVMRGSSERMSVRLAAHIEAMAGASPNSLELESAQRIMKGGRPLWIVNGREITCIFQGALACTTTADFADHGLVVGMASSQGKGSSRPRDFRILGVAPSWVAAVQVRVGSRNTWRIPVRSNVYGMRSAAPSFVVGFCGATAAQTCRPNRPLERRPSR